MTLKLGVNISSLKAQRQLSKTGSELGTVYERLSSGLRINKAADDAAGLAIADSLRSDRRVFAQGVRNFNDGISLLNVADSAVQSLTDIVTRLKELAEQAANGAYSATQRKALDAEAQALSKEFTRIIQTTKFNGFNLLDGSNSQLTLQGGYGQNGSIAGSMGGTMGTGNFTFSASLSDGSFSENSGLILLKDINNDGNLDMISGALADSTARYTSVRLGNGSGSFSAEYTISNEGMLALEDLDGDGILDFIGTDASSNIMVRSGTGSGTFGAATTYNQSGATISNIQFGDLNGDGINDMVILNSTSGFQANIAVRIGTGSGSFGASASYTIAGNFVSGLTLGDFNNDGNIDYAANSHITAGSISLITVGLGTGSGTFSAGVSYTGAGSNRDITAGDLNGDGILDLVSTGVASSDGVTIIRLGNGNGTFGNSSTFSDQSGGTRAVSLGDFNGDGILDIATTGYEDSTSATVSIRLGNGSGTFGSRTSYADVTTYSAALGLGDINNDGVLDYINGTRLSGPNAGYAVSLGTTKSGTSALLGFSLKNIADAKQALNDFTNKLNILYNQRGQIGALQSRVETGMSNLQSMADNYAAAESRIRDADIAEETAKMIRLQILQQATTAVLAQANLQPGVVLKLLK